MHAARIAREYRFDERAVVLDAHLRGGSVDSTCRTQVFAATVDVSRSANNTTQEADVVHVVCHAAWGVLQNRFAEVKQCRYVPRAYMVRLVELNDLRVASELDVWRAVAQ